MSQLEESEDGSIRDEFQLISEWHQHVAGLEPTSAGPRHHQLKGDDDKTVVPGWLQGLWDQYRRWLLSEAGTVAKMETALSVLCNLSSGGSSDVLMETRNCALALFQLVNDSVYYAATRKALASAATSSQEAKLRDALASVEFRLQKPPVHALNTGLAFIRAVQLLAEMACRQHAPSHTVALLVSVESIKAVIKLLILYLSNSTTITDQLPPRPPPELLSSYPHSASAPSSSLDPLMRLPSLEAEFASSSLSRIPPKALFQYLFAEVLYIVRPLVFLLAQHKFGVSSWTPWVMSLAVDAWSHVAKGKLAHATAEEQAVLSSRTLGYVWYLLRGPM